VARHGGASTKEAVPTIDLESIGAAAQLVADGRGRRAQVIATGALLLVNQSHEDSPSDGPRGLRSGLASDRLRVQYPTARIIVSTLRAAGHAYAAASEVTR
jgi:hypothetical protein